MTMTFFYLFLFRFLLPTITTYLQIIKKGLSRHPRRHSFFNDYVHFLLFNLKLDSQINNLHFQIYSYSKNEYFRIFTIMFLSVLFFYYQPLLPGIVDLQIIKKSLFRCDDDTFLHYGSKLFTF